ncbi:hypothetical protein JOF29_002269 [Kribbella aluminosa]|uniref:Helicase XPB/Ssl2 N-terminal domain-containing protein n=1 Tax=Kribbella aluminosa TaxID=416017 RepID=A0ABS4UHR8_9ACTN|nr:hypothetical protein [Kribbella aluminosa]MBP2351186.1 hypothetical protein [Kribbella aluminosa]
MDQIEDFVNRVPAWLDQTGAMAEPDLGLLRDLLECRASVLGIGDPWSWPKESLADTVLEVAPYVLPVDAAWRAAAAATLPVLRDLVVFEGDESSAESLRRDVTPVLAVLTGGLGEKLVDPFAWSVILRMQHRRAGATDRKAWLAEFDALNWEERDRLVGPLRREAVALGGDPFGGVTIPAPRTVLPSEVAATAGQAPLALAVVELARWLVAQPPISAGGYLDDDTVAHALAGTTLTDAAAVQEAWRIAALSDLVGSTGARVVPGPQFAAWPDLGRRLEAWCAMVRAVVIDVPLPDRDEVMAAIYSAYHPGLPADFDAAIRSDLARVAIDRLRRLGLFDQSGDKLSRLGVQGLLLNWLGWDTPGRWNLVAGPWRPDLTTADIRAWIAAGLNGVVVDEPGQVWLRTADPLGFAGQLVDLMLDSADGVERGTAFAFLSQLGSAVTPVVDRLSGTRLHAYRAMWVGGGAPAEPDQSQLQLFLRDQLAMQDALAAKIADLQPGAPVDLGRFDFGGALPDFVRERIGNPGPLSEADLAKLRQTMAEQRAEIAELVAGFDDPV